MAFKVLLFAALISLSVAQLEVPGRLVSRSSTRSIIPFAAPVCDNVNVYTVCSDCTKVLVCLGAANDNKDCATASPETPYCSNGVCSATPSNTVDCPPNVMKCTGVGFYPDPKTCQIYHYCEKINEDSSVYECPPNYVYNAATKLCKQKVLAADCVTVKCDKAKLFASYGTSKQFYAYCKYDTAGVLLDISMLKCVDNSSFDGSSCVFACPKAGNFQHSDTSKYYQCYLSGGKFVYQVLSCATGKIFDLALQVCITNPNPPPAEP